MPKETKMDAKEIARRVLELEAKSLSDLVPLIDDNFDKAVDLILNTKGKVVITGMGKSGLICQKIAATMASTGTPAFFLHPAEGVHGDLGVLGKEDILIAVSNSGETAEILEILPVVKRMAIKLITIAGKKNSTLESYSDAHLDVTVKEEACPLGLAPTSSTTATLAMGDALAVALLELRGFKKEDFAELHPAGSLGKKLKPVFEVMHKGSDLPTCSEDTLMKDAILTMTKKRLGIIAVLKDDKLKGVITDGDLRRTIEKAEKDSNLLNTKAADIMFKTPRTIDEGSLLESAVQKMEEFSITALMVVDKDNNLKGIIHLHDLLRAGVI